MINKDLIDLGLESIINIKKESKINQELINYLTRMNYRINTSKVQKDLDNNIEPLLYLNNNTYQAFAYKNDVSEEYINLTESTFITHENSALLDYEIRKETVIDSKGFDINIHAYNGQDNDFNLYVSFIGDNVSGYIVDSNKKYIHLNFYALNTLINEINDESLTLYFIMKESMKQLTNYIISNKINIKEQLYRR